MKAKAATTAVKAKRGKTAATPEWSVRASDRALFDRLLATFVPPDAFDVHAHLYPAETDGRRPGGVDVDINLYRRLTAEYMGEFMPTAGLFFPSPAMSATARGNAFLIDQMRSAKRSRGLLLARPGDNCDQMEKQVLETRAAGLKVYHTFTKRPDSVDAKIEEYLPPWMWELADRHGLVIMLHLVRPRALADEDNQRSLRRNLRKWKSAKVILAHAARGFCAQHTIEGIRSLAGLTNVFFDTSAVCEPDAMLAILKQFGPDRLMYGSDFPVSVMRGRVSSVGDGFAWFMEKDVAASAWRDDGPTLVGIESLLAIQRAARLAGLKDSAIEKIFRTNARRLLNVE